MRVPLIAANWKMHKTEEEAVLFINKFKQQTIPLEKVQVVICAPFTALPGLMRSAGNMQLHIGAQNMFWQKEGAYTGEISPLMLRELGVRFVIIGHSERRRYFGEDDGWSTTRCWLPSPTGCSRSFAWARLSSNGAPGARRR